MPWTAIVCAGEFDGADRGELAADEERVRAIAMRGRARHDVLFVPFLDLVDQDHASGVRQALADVVSGEA